MVFPSISVEMETVYSVPWTRPSKRVLYLCVAASTGGTCGGMCGGGGGGDGGGGVDEQGEEGNGLIWRPPPDRRVEWLRLKLTLRCGWCWCWCWWWWGPPGTKLGN